MKADFRKHQVVAYIAIADSPPLGSIIELEDEAGNTVTVRMDAGEVNGKQIMLWGPEVSADGTPKAT